MIKVTVTESETAIVLTRKCAGVELRRYVTNGVPLFIFLSEAIQALTQSPNAQHPGAW